MKKSSTKTTIVELIGHTTDGDCIMRHVDGRLEIAEPRTDWARVDALTDEQITAAMKDDPDCEGAEEIDWSKAEWMPPLLPKQPISIRLDADVLAFFKEAGPGYQKRINAVLRQFMKAERARRAGRAGTQQGTKARRSKPTEAAE